MSRISTPMMLSILIIALFATLSMAADVKVVSTTTKFGNVKPSFYFDQTDQFEGEWSMEILTPKFHQILPHNPTFEAGFTPETFPEVNPLLVYSLATGLQVPCGPKFVADPSKGLQKLTCSINQASTYIELQDFSFALIPGADVAAQPFPQVRFTNGDKNIDITLDAKPFSTTDWTHDLCSACIFTSTTSYLNATANNHLQFAMNLKSTLKNTPDQTFYIELKGENNDDYVFLIHDPAFKPPTPKATTKTEDETEDHLQAAADEKTTILAISSPALNTTFAKMTLNKDSNRLDIVATKDNGLPSGLVSSLLLPNLYVILNPNRKSAIAPTKSPSIRLYSEHWQAEIVYDLALIPTQNADWVDKSDKGGKQSGKVPISALIVVLVMALGTIAFMGFKIVSLGKRLHSAENAEPLLVH